MAPTAVIAQSAPVASKVIGIHWNGFRDQYDAFAPGQLPTGPIVGEALTGRTLPPIPSPWSYHALGIFCKAEVKLNSVLPFPVMMRLGDVRRAEELDGKGDALTEPQH